MSLISKSAFEREVTASREKTCGRIAYKLQFALLESSNLPLVCQSVILPTEIPSASALLISKYAARRCYVTNYIASRAKKKLKILSVFGNIKKNICTFVLIILSIIYNNKIY